MNFEDVIKEAQDLLSENTEWKDRYANYADIFLANTNSIKSNRNRFNQFPPLYFYISTTNVKNAKSSLLLDIRLSLIHI